MFYRLNEQGDAEIFHDDGDRVTRLDADVYPVGSDLSVRYEHSRGIVLSVEDAEALGIEVEG